MKLVIEIEFGNDSMLRYSQVRAVIADAVGTSAHRAKPEVGDGGILRGVNGNRVGTWAVTDHICSGCFREESVCSADPCPDVIADRGE